MIDHARVKSSEIIFETTSHWVRETPRGFEVYAIDGTSSRMCSFIGKREGYPAKDRAIRECVIRAMTVNQ